MSLFAVISVLLLFNNLSPKQDLRSFPAEPTQIAVRPIIAQPTPLELWSDVHEAVIEPGQNLTLILRNAGFSTSDAHRISELVKPALPPKGLQTARRYRFSYPHVYGAVPKQFYLEKSDLEALEVIYGPELWVALHKVEPSYHRRSVGGRIKTSLYRSAREAGLSPRLISELSQLFHDDINFRALHAGDRFKLVFDEAWSPSGPTGEVRIQAAEFSHRGKSYFRYFSQELDAFLDEKGNFLDKTFLEKPVANSYLSSRYSGRRFHPVLKRYTAHLGTDFAALQGSEILALADGVVLEARYSRYNGNYVKIRHDKTYKTQYLHMVRIAKGLRPGDTVKKGQVIGYVGSTGLADGTHVCLRLWKNDKQVDFLRENLPRKAPIQANRARLLMDIEEKQALLDAVVDPHAAPVMLGRLETAR